MEDICQPACSSRPREFTVVDDQLFFITDGFNPSYNGFDSPSLYASGGRIESFITVYNGTASRTLAFADVHVPKDLLPFTGRILARTRGSPCSVNSDCPSDRFCEASSGECRWCNSLNGPCNLLLHHGEEGSRTNCEERCDEHPSMCRDSGGDCCANEASDDPATCADGYTPSKQPQSYDNCPNYACHSDGWDGSSMCESNADCPVEAFCNPHVGACQSCMGDHRNCGSLALGVSCEERCNEHPAMCRDEAHDCCANEVAGEPASCAEGFVPSNQPQSFDNCPNFACVPVSAASETEVRYETFLAFSASSHMLAEDASLCRDSGNDCCANEASGEPAACADDYTPSNQPQSYDDCPNYAARLRRSCCPSRMSVPSTKRRTARRRRWSQSRTRDGCTRAAASSTSRSPPISSSSRPRASTASTTNKIRKICMKYTVHRGCRACGLSPRGTTTCCRARSHPG